MVKAQCVPDYIFESSWEVCHMVGGIYTVLSTRAKTMQKLFADRVFFIGPDFGEDVDNPLFTADEKLFSDWRAKAQQEGLHVRVGRWNVPGEPIALLVDFRPFYAQKNEIYGQMWADFQVDSLHGYGDYDEASMFSYAAAKVVESFYRHVLPASAKVVYQGHEWMTCLGLLYIHKHVPQIGTIFTTHATSIGRSIAGNMKPLYEYLWAYRGDQMAEELNMQSKHSVEKQAAKYVDCFTTVSDITAVECRELLDKPVDVVLPNGFEDDFVPRGKAFNAQRSAARKTLLQVANALTGDHFDDQTLIVSTSGRYEFRNKGIDVFIEAIHQLRRAPLPQKVVAFIEVPGWVAGPREDLQVRLCSGQTFDTPLDNPICTHCLHDAANDRVLSMMNYLGMHNALDERVKLIFVPCYLTGQDGIFNQPYYQLVCGNDLCVYPSYYEPWGYTPLEAIAFHVPCITTDLAGFGLWANHTVGHVATLADGVCVVHRDDNNYQQVATAISQAIAHYAKADETQRKACQKAAWNLSKAALWKHFIPYYEKAYALALHKAAARA